MADLKISELVQTSTFGPTDLIPVVQVGANKRINGSDLQGAIAPNATTAIKGIVQLSNSYSGTSETIATTEKALKDGVAYALSTFSVPDATLLAKGIVQLSNSYIGTSQSLSTTEKALSDGLATREQTLTKGNLSEVTSSALTISNGTSCVIGSGTTIQVKDASTSQKGAVQLSNSYNGTSQTLATTEKALSDGLATKQGTFSTGNLSEATSSVLTISSGTGAVIGTGTTIQVKDSSTSQKGAVQLSNAYNGTSQTLAVTEKALSDGLATKVTPTAYMDIFTPTAGQTVFTLAHTKLSNYHFLLVLNKGVRREGTDFTVVGTTLTWLDPAGETLQLNDNLVAYYYY